MNLPRPNGTVARVVALLAAVSFLTWRVERLDRALAELTSEVHALQLQVAGLGAPRGGSPDGPR